MISLYESILSGGRRGAIDRGASSALINILHDHSQGVGNLLMFADDQEDSVVSNNGVLEFNSGLVVRGGADVRRVIRNTGIKAPHIRIDSYNEYDVEKCLGNLTCQGLFIDAFTHVKNVNVKFTTFGPTYIIADNWRTRTKKVIDRVGSLTFGLGRSSKDTILENFNIDNSAGSCETIVFNDGNPIFKNFKASGYKRLRIYDLSCWDERFSSVATCITQLFDKDFQFIYLDQGKETTRNCKQLKKIAAFFNNPKRYVITEPAYKLTDTKISDLWDLSGMPEVNEICIEDNNVSLYLFKEQRRALTYLPMFIMNDRTKEDMLESYKTVDGWYVIFRKRY